ncbi:LapA family protein [Alteromonas sp. a30]|uniref:LapA family protein n=1 Tax=Alteromonas sp. a30 TaxID=2730917 RepID=UPI0022831F09|nr:LapA family protein [Alteromonas sp. a30]MCY7294084.1 LapA family protein [Alteromonas sp. a30]
MTLFFLIVISLTVLVGAIIIGANNTGVVMLDYFWGTHSFTLAVLIALSFIVGVILASAVWGLFSLKLRMKISSLDKKLKNLNKHPVN